MGTDKSHTQDVEHFEPKGIVCEVDEKTKQLNEKLRLWLRKDITDEELSLYLPSQYKSTWQKMKEFANRIYYELANNNHN